MAVTTRLRAGAVRFVVLALLASMVAMTAGTNLAAAEDPPVYITSWGGFGSGNGKFNGPTGVAVDGDGYVYVVDGNNGRVQKFTPSGTYVSQWGEMGQGDGQFTWPYGVAVDADGYVYVADTSNHRIQKFTSSGVYVMQWGGQGAGNGQLNDPTGVAVGPDGTIYVADMRNRRIQRFTSAGNFLNQWGTLGSGDGQFAYPMGVTVDHDGNVYVVDDGLQRVQKFTSTGTFLTKWGSGRGTGDGEFSVPRGVAVDADGYVYVSDYENRRIQKFTSAGTYVTQWATSGHPEGVAWAEGSVYVADTESHHIQRFAEGGDITDPTVDLRTPPQGAIYHRNQAVTADYSCADDPSGSGIATCAGTASDGSPVDTSTIGDHDFTVTATDNVGHTTETTHTCTVADPRPDGRIKKGATGTFVGDDIYNTDGSGQSRAGSAARGSSVTYYVSVQNDAPFPDVLRIKGTATNSRFAVQYTVARDNVTPQVTAGTYTTPVLAPGAAVSVKVVVTVRNTAPAGASLTGTLTTKASTNSTIRDTVKFITRRS